MGRFDELPQAQASQLSKALDRLESSARKVATLSPQMSALSDEDLETWESFLARFARASDIFLARCLRAYVMREDPGFRGSMRDFIDQGEKLGLLEDPEGWLALRELRNLVAHEYVEQKLQELFESCRAEASRLLALRARLSLT